MGIVRRGVGIVRRAAQGLRGVQQGLRDVQVAGAQPFAERLGLGVEAGLRGDALAEDAADDEVEGAQVRQDMAGDSETGGPGAALGPRPRLGEELPQPFGGQFVREPAPGGLGPHPDADVGVAALVAAAGSGDETERRPPGRPRRQGRGQRRLGDGVGYAAVGGRADGDPPPVGQDGEVRYGALVGAGGLEDAVGRALGGWGEDVEAGVAGEGEFDGGAAERPADRVGVRVADDEPQQRARGLLGAGVGPVGADEFPPHMPGAARGDGERVLHLCAHEGGLGLHLQPRQDEDDLVAEAAEAVEADLEGGRRRLPAHALDTDPVGALLGEAHGVEAGGDVGPRIPGAGRLVEELCRDGAEVDDASGAVVLGDHGAAVGTQFGEREAGAAQPGARVLGEEGVVAAGGLRAALQYVPGDDRAREGVVRVRRPAEVRGGGPGDERGVGDPPGDDDVGARAQTGGDAVAAEVGVRGQGPRVRGGEVVALDVRDTDGDAEPPGQRADGVGEPGGVEPPGIADDPHAPFVREAEALLQLAQEGAGVPGDGVLQPVAAEDEHGQLGEVVTGEDVEGAAGEHLAQGVEAVAVETGGVADAEGGGRGRGGRGLGHGRAPPADPAPPGARPVPGGPANAWAMSSHRSASAPSARRARSARWARWVTRRQRSSAAPVTRWAASSGP